MKINVVGMDPSIRNWGYAMAVLDTETLEIAVQSLDLSVTAKESAKAADGFRRSRLHMARMRKNTADASICFAELPTGSQSASAAKAIGVCVGIMAAVEIPLICVSPNDVKIATVGKRTATKSQMINWGLRRHPEASWMMRKSKGTLVPVAANEHLADAIGAIYAGLLTDEFTAAVAMFNSLKAETE